MLPWAIIFIQSLNLLGYRGKTIYRVLLSLMNSMNATSAMPLSKKVLLMAYGFFGTQTL